MPHKHTRRDKDDSTYDLPPTQIARPLPVVAPKLARQNANKSGGNKGKGKPNANDASKDRAPDAPRGAKRKRGAADKKDDAPRAFKRLMAFADGKKFRSGLDDGSRDAAPKKKKKSKVPEGDATVETENAQEEAPTIRPGEKLSDFARRVDAALPVMGLVNKGGKKDPLGLKTQRTRKEKKMHKLYDEWRREEAAIQEKRREEAEEAEEAEMENEEAGVKWKLDLEDQGGKGKKKKKGKKGRSVWESAEADDDDPWEELKKKRGEKKAGLHDFAQAPPELKTKPKELFKVRGAGVDVGTIPKAAGSLKQREELQSVREEVLASYRKMMQAKREKREGQEE
ncbi:hypothetical protein KVR01_011239 [Diaporthe batatas]|uniref:uncharacterized protein n=1 Tax=Diaporthe batatas TaxID=748121 RepID=UPI001D03E0A7|nr:uncharacterized protein KVR01_011239 [Diaporthe batatas]KAG8158796.1 hypothetical protein KVR01_011239 [Diaporthe batatas]